MNKLFVLFTLLTVTTWGQDFSLTGKVIDSDTKEPLEYATIVMEKADNPQEVTGGITDAQGNFDVKAPRGTYHLKVQFFSYKTHEIKNFNLNANKQLGTITLHIDVAELEGVEVMAERTTVELHLDKKIYNVGQDLTVKGGSVSDVLDNVPSVSVDVEGKVSLRGNENVRILINGKPSALSGVGDEALRQLPAESIERVEIISNPSARYDAEGTAGIINIILKKGRGLGFMGSVVTTVGTPETYGLSTNLSLRKEKWTFFNNTSFDYRKAPGEMSFYQTYYDNNGNVSGYQDDLRENNRLRKGINFNLGAEYRITDNTSITNNVIFSYRKGDNVVDANFNNYDENRVLSVQRYRGNFEDETDKKFQYSFNFEHKFNDKGHKLTADYQYSTSTDDEIAQIKETVLTTNTALPTEKNINYEEEKSHLVQVDYVLPFGKDNKTQFEAGYRGSFDQSDTDFTMGYLDVNGNLTVDANYSNHFIFDQNVNAVYTQLGTKAGKWNFMGGLRMEHTDITSLLVDTNEDYSKSYTDLFPSLYAGYEFSESQQLSVSYSRRLQRPRSRFMNPFVSRSSNTNMFSGNPDLNPTYTNAYDIAYLKRWEKFSLNSSIYYNYSTQTFEFVSLETGDFVTIDNPSDPSSPTLVPIMLRRPINLSDESRFGVEFTATYTPKRNWRFMWNINFFNSKTEGTYSYVNYLNQTIKQNFSAENTSWFTRLTAKIPLPYKIDFQTNMMYMGPRKTAQSNIKGMFSTNVALSKEVLKGKGTLSLNVSDLFNTRMMKSDTWTETIYSYSEMQWRCRQILLNFTYRFGNMQGQQREKRGNRGENGGGDDFEFEG